MPFFFIQTFLLVGFLFCPNVNCQDVHQQICSWPLNFQFFFFNQLLTLVDGMGRFGLLFMMLLTTD